MKDNISVFTIVFEVNFKNYLIFTTKRITLQLEVMI